MFKVGEEINITGLKVKQIINIPYHIIEKVFGKPILVSNVEVLWKVQFLEDNYTVSITNGDILNQLEDETRWCVKANTKEIIERVKLILIN